MVGRQLRTGVVTIALLLSLMPTAAPTSAVEDDWAWATVRSPGSGFSMSKPWADASEGQPIPVDIERLSKGLHRLRFFWDARFVPEFGHVQVTALTRRAHLCQVFSWRQGEAWLEIETICFGRAGTPKNVPFSLAFIAMGTSRSVAYAWANDASADEYTPRAGYNHTPSGLPITVERDGVGRYRVTFPGAPRHGHIQVSTYGPDPGACQAGSVGSPGADRIVEVVCRDPDGAFADLRFDALYLKDTSPKGSGGKRWAYLFANKPGARSYVPKQRTREQRPNGTPRISRIRRGVYKVRLPKMAKGGAAQVTAKAGHGAQRCHVGSISGQTPQVIDVRCFSGNGRRSADSRFYLLYER